MYYQVFLPWDRASSKTCIDLYIQIERQYYDVHKSGSQLGWVLKLDALVNYSSKLPVKTTSHSYRTQERMINHVSREIISVHG